MGGAENHRMRLDDGVLIKDNHIAVAGGVAEAVRRAKAAGLSLPLQVEVDRLDQIEPALVAGADRPLLDNMTPDPLRAAGALVQALLTHDASAGVHPRTIRPSPGTGAPSYPVVR